MKLFVKDHLSIIILYLVTFVSLPFVIEKLDGFENHYGYFCLLAFVLLTILLVIRYLRRKKMYANLKGIHLNQDQLQIYQPLAPIEKRIPVN